MISPTKQDLAAAAAPSDASTPKSRFIRIPENEREEEILEEGPIIKNDYFSDSDDFSDDEFGFGFYEDDKALEEKAKETDFIYDKNNAKEFIVIPKNWNTLKKELEKIKKSLETEGGILYVTIENIINSKTREEIKYNIKVALTELKKERKNNEYNKLIEIYKKVYKKKIAKSNMRNLALRNSRSRRGGKRKKTKRRKKNKGRKYKSSRRRPRRPRKRRKSGRKRTKRRRRH